MSCTYTYFGDQPVNPTSYCLIKKGNVGHNNRNVKEGEKHWLGGTDLIRDLEWRKKHTRTKKNCSIFWRNQICPHYMWWVQLGGITRVTMTSPKIHKGHQLLPYLGPNWTNREVRSCSREETWRDDGALQKFPWHF